MPFRINHIHIKAFDPRKAADWWVSAFGFRIVSDDTRPSATASSAARPRAACW